MPMTTSPTLHPATATATATARSVTDHSTLEGELIRCTDSLLAAVAAQEPHEPPLDELVAFLHQEVLPHVAAEDELLHDASPGAPTALLAQALSAQHGRLTDLVGEVDAARTGIDAVRAASAVVALFIAVADAEDALLLPALTFPTPTSDVGAPSSAVRVPGADGGAPTVAPNHVAAVAAPGTPAHRDVTLDLCGRDYETCRRELADAVHSLWRGDTLTITSGPELLALRFELESCLPAGFRWSLPAGTADRSTTTVERL